MIRELGYSLRTIWCFAFLYGLLFVSSLAVSAPQEAEQKVKSYAVNRFVKEFPEKLDLSTPESAYATFNRIIAQGDYGQLRQLSVKRVRSFLPSSDVKEKVTKEETEMWLNANILEVRTFRDTVAGVIALLPSREGGIEEPFSLRWFEREEGEWRNRGEDRKSSIEEARRTFERGCELGFKEAEQAKAIDVKPTDTDVESFVQFLKEHGEEPSTFVMKALASHKIVLFGEIHHRQRSWDFCRQLVERPDFPEDVGIIFLELKSHSQPQIDSFLANETLDITPVIATLRDTLIMGWPDQGVLDFFKAVWRVNQKLPDEKRIRIILADVPTPYAKVKSQEDIAKYFKDINRDRFMADRISEFLRNQKDNRHCLFIVGMGHALLNPGARFTPAGYYLRREWGEQAVYSIFTHTVKGSETGTYGRLRHGAFDFAFAENGNRPVGFKLKNSPFGAESFDTLLDFGLLGSYHDNYDGYVFLGPLETELKTHLIEGFYDDEFVREIDRRCHLFLGQGLVEKYGLADLSAQSFLEWMRGKGYGNLYWRERDLGPIDAWRMTDEEVAKWKHEQPEIK